MTLGIRKIFVVSLVAGLFLLANLWLVVNWLNNLGVIVAAQYVRHEYLTGTAITIIVVLLILLVGQGSRNAGVWARRCSVCDERVAAAARYCSGCGSKA